MCEIIFGFKIKDLMKILRSFAASALLLSLVACSGERKPEYKTSSPEKTATTQKKEKKSCCTSRTPARFPVSNVQVPVPQK